MPQATAKTIDEAQSANGQEFVLLPDEDDTACHIAIPSQGMRVQVSLSGIEVFEEDKESPLHALYFPVRVPPKEAS